MTGEWLEAYRDHLGGQFPELEQAEKQGRGLEWLVAHGISAAEALASRASFSQYAFVFPERYDFDEEVLALFSEESLRRYRLIPLFRFDDRIYVATADPDDLDSFEFLSKQVGATLEPVVAMGSEIDRCLNRIFLTHDKISQAILDISERAQTIVEEDDPEVEELSESSAPAVQLVSRILLQGINLGASDIHLEPFEKKVILRYRIDGVLREYPAPPYALMPAIVSRIKIASDLDIAERRLPQDGRTTVKLDGKNYDLRVSVMPGLHGEAIVIRVLSSAAVTNNLTDLGFQAEVLTRYQRIIRRPHGIVLVTGPTGSGKSTTLYSTLRTIATPEKKMITLEDPVEYQMDGILQIPINAEIGYSFGVGLKAILRHDPDVVLIGEIRDLESAEIAVRAALTGHALFSTLHTNSAPLAITRLMDMGIPAYQLAAALNGVLAQRLVRRLCKSCRQPVQHDPGLLAEVGAEGLEGTCFRAVGCSECNGIGYRGRCGIHEVLEITPEIRKWMGTSTDLNLLEEIAVSQGYRTLRHSAVHRMFAGDTSLEEVLEVTGAA